MHGVRTSLQRDVEIDGAIGDTGQTGPYKIRQVARDNDLFVLIIELLRDILELRGQIAAQIEEFDLFVIAIGGHQRVEITHEASFGRLTPHALVSAPTIACAGDERGNGHNYGDN